MTTEIEVLFDVTDAADALSALANRHRYRLVKMICETELDVATLVANVDVSQSAVSQHLGILRAVKLVTSRRERQTVYYSASDEAKRLVHAIDKALTGKKDSV